MTAHTLHVRNPSKLCGDFVAVDRADLEVRSGEFVMLLGPSGSGKTTILMTIEGFTRPTEGAILVDGRDITALPPEKRNLGMVFQGDALLPHPTVAGNVGFPLRVRGITRGEADDRTERALDLVQLGHPADRLPRQLSGGQQQHVALALALVFDPYVVLLEEPLSALDKKLRTELQWELKAIDERIGTAFVYVTHDQEEALSMSDRIAILDHGRIAQLGAPGELYERPASRFIAAFPGKSNVIEGEVLERRSDGFPYRVGGVDLLQSGTAEEERVLVALRPEKIEVHGAEPREPANRVSGRLASWTSYRTSFQLRVRTEALGEIIVRQPALERPLDPTPDAPVWLAWDADASVVVRPD